MSKTEGIHESDLVWSVNSSLSCVLWKLNEIKSIVVFSLYIKDPGDQGNISSKGKESGKWTLIHAPVNKSHKLTGSPNKT